MFDLYNKYHEISRRERKIRVSKICALKNENQVTLFVKNSKGISHWKQYKTM